MKDISLKDLLSAGCHFGHKVERWHPKAAEFIFGEREGIHIIDLVKTRDGLKKAAEYLENLGKSQQVVLFVATKRQAKGVVTEAARRAGVAFLTNRWIGGFITNWDEVKKNIDKVDRMRKEKEEGSWKKFPKHEQVKLEKDLRKLDAVYTGVAQLARLPDAIFIVDIKREIASLREAIKKGLPIVALVDTNADPNLVDYPIPANDDAVGSIQYIVNFLADAYIEGKNYALRQGHSAELSRSPQGKGEKKAPRQAQGKEEKNEKIKDKKEEKKQITDNKEQEKKEGKESVKDTSDGGKLRRSRNSDSSEVERTEK